jgi:hypothetical protein
MATNRNEITVKYGLPNEYRGRQDQRKTYLLKFNTDIFVDGIGVAKVRDLRQHGTTMISVVPELPDPETNTKYTAWVEPHTIRRLDDPDLTAYEIKRLANMIANQKELDVLDLRGSFAAGSGMTTPENTGRKVVTWADQGPPPLPTRRQTPATTRLSKKNMRPDEVETSDPAAKKQRSGLEADLLEHDASVLPVEPVVNDRPGGLGERHVGDQEVDRDEDEEDALGEGDGEDDGVAPATKRLGKKNMRPDEVETSGPAAKNQRSDLEDESSDDGASVLPVNDRPEGLGERHVGDQEVDLDEGEEDVEEEDGKGDGEDDGEEEQDKNDEDDGEDQDESEDKSMDARFRRLYQKLRADQAAEFATIKNELKASLSNRGHRAGGASRPGRSKQSAAARKASSKAARKARGLNWITDFDPKTTTAREAQYTLQPFINAMVDPSEDLFRAKVTPKKLQLDQESVLINTYTSVEAYAPSKGNIEVLVFGVQYRVLREATNSCACLPVHLIRSVPIPSHSTPPHPIPSHPTPPYSHPHPHPTPPHPGQPSC